MIARTGIVAFFLFWLTGLGVAQRNIQLASPDKTLLFTFAVSEGRPQYSVSYKNKPLIEHSALGLKFEDGKMIGSNLSVNNVPVSQGVEEYSLPEGKTSHVRERYQEVTIPMQDRSGKTPLVYLHVRAFNDAIAFRYEFPAQKNREKLILTEENTTFNLAGNPIAKLGYMESFTTSHEHRYTTVSLDAVANDTLIDVPALFSFPGKIFLAITEANLLDYAGMSLMKIHGTLTSRLSPLPGRDNIKVVATLPHHSPWRVMMISDRVGELIESNVLTNLSEPCRVRDLSWLKPGKASFHWWNGDIMPDTTFEPGANFNFNKYYIDFCSRNGIQYHTVIGYRGVPWYENDGFEYQPGPNTNILKPRAALEIQRICDYGKSKGVGIRFWVHWQALYPRLDSAFALFEKWGIAGMMVDFMDRDDQQMVNIQEEILRKAADHHLEIQFHGAYKPTGLSRTYPNESTREGTLNYENNKGGNLITPNDDIDIPFTRLLAGPTDYHLGGFRALPLDSFRQTFTRPHMLGTRCHMLAMYVVLENHLSMVCDYPEAYEGQEGFDFIKEVPTVWDQTIVPAAEIDKWVSVARRKGTAWYIGVINNDSSRSVSLPLNFLPKGKFHAGIYKDAPDAAIHPNNLVRESKELTSADSLLIDLPAGGGYAIRIDKIN